MEPHKIIASDIKRELPCKLTDDELLELAITKAKTEAELDELQDEFADVKRNWNKRIEDVEKRLDHMGGELRTRERKRVITCHERIVTETRMVEVVREDTNEVVDRRTANLFEAGQVMPPAKHHDTAGDEPPAEDDPSVDEQLAAAHAETMRAAGVEENDEGDVVPPAGDGKKPRKGKRK